MKVIGLCGYAGSGKDTAAEALIAEGWQRVSFADPIREMALAIDPIVLGPSRLSTLVEQYGWENAKRVPEVRRLLQVIGTEAVREIIGEDAWLNLAFAKMEVSATGPSPPKGFVITDMRHINEYQAVREEPGLIVRISRPNVGPVNDHQSDRFLADFEVDHEIVNDGDKEKLHAAILAIAGGETK